MNRPIIALDFPDKKSIVAFLSRFPQEESLFLKVGMELFYQEGPSIVTWLKSLGHDTFLDLKLHDIPNTVESAMRGIAKLGVSLTNVHAAGGIEMMRAAKRGLEHSSTKLIAVTQLTSTSEEAMQHDQGLTMSLNESVCHYAKMTAESGLDGVVCSALEVPMIKSATHNNFKCLTPGIRPGKSNICDQKRVATPRQARDLEADFIVVGRPITQSSDPFQAYLAIKKEWSI